MGTYYVVTYRGDVASKPLKHELEYFLSTIDEQLSNWNKDSWVRRFNRHDSTTFIPIPDHASRF
jgi:thiamine biosynthesis lipoprotein ApbE